MRERLLEYIRSHTDVTPALAAKSLELDRQAVQTELSAMMRDGLVTTAINSLGVTRYRIMEQKEQKPRAKPANPYTPNKVTGAYQKNGNLVVCFQRKAHGNTVTITREDLNLLTGLYGNDGAFSD